MTNRERAEQIFPVDPRRPLVGEDLRQAVEQALDQAFLDGRSSECLWWTEADGTNVDVSFKRGTLAGLEMAANLADDFICNCEHPHCRDSEDIRKLILAKAKEMEGGK